MTKKTRSILMSVLVLVLCLALVAGGAYALFTDEVDLESHLESGKMAITLKRVSLTKKHLDATTGYLVDAPENTEIVDFTEETDRNVFDLGQNEKIVPLCSYTAKMVIENKEEKSDVAFAYWVEIRFDDTAALALADQLQVTVVSAKGTKQVFLNEGLSIGNDGDPVGTLTRGASEEFTVTVTFVDDRVHTDVDNNDAKAQTLDFDLVVHAVQVTN